MISIVNGYICTTSCDVAAAKQGKDPNASPGSAPGVSGKGGKTSSFAGQPATTLDGLLKDLPGSGPAAPANNNLPQAQVDRLV
ncbi:MAG: hypothetical protein WBG10_14315 [Pseudolabrys sp.]